MLELKKIVGEPINMCTRSPLAYRGELPSMARMEATCINALTRTEPCILLEECEEQSGRRRRVFMERASRCSWCCVDIERSKRSRV
jgi:hypothetical protein